MKESYDNKMNFKKYEKGDVVWLYSLVRNKGILLKL